MTRIKIQWEKSLNDFLKKFALTVLALVTAAFANEGTFEKEGFLTTENCAKQGAFTDCYMENYVCGEDFCNLKTEPGVDNETQLVLFSHDDGVIYKLDTAAVPRSVFDAGVNRNAVSITGEYDAATQTITVQTFEAPPPPKKSFFKGCL
ncbi:MAG: hypothetical protein U9Q62_02380 [Campylobacterota bacterium]|nr:hypothetical protein [Campylobacterota bacterium]